MSLNKKRKTENVATWLDRFPIEIILDVFEYLQSNDILFSFFHFNQRFQDLIIEQKRFLTNFEMPYSNLIYWKEILLIIGSQIQKLVINHEGLLLPLDLFPSLTSIIVTSPFFIDLKIIKSIMQSNRFNQLHSLKIKQMILSDDIDDNDRLFLKNIFNHQNQIQTFECTISGSSSSFDYLAESKFISNIIRLTIKLDVFTSIFTLFKSIPFVKYLNIVFKEIGINNSPEKCSVQLNKLHMTYDKKNLSNDYSLLAKIIKLFSISLKSLALNISNVPVNGEKLHKKLLISMISLTEFHLYARTDYLFQGDILSTFQNQFWFNRNWIIGTHGNERYLYTLPFYFDELHEFIDFTSIRTTNDKIFQNNSYIWYKIQKIQLLNPSQIDVNLLQIQMPKLVSIVFHDHKYTDSNKKFIQTISKKNDDILTNMNYLDPLWLINRLSNVKYLILDIHRLSLLTNQIIMNNIQRLYIYNTMLKLFTDHSYVSFPNLEYLVIDHTSITDDIFVYSSSVPKLLSKLNKLKILFIYFSGIYNSDIRLGINYNKYRMTTQYLFEILQFSLSTDTFFLQDFPYWFQISKKNMFLFSLLKS